MQGWVKSTQQQLQQKAPAAAAPALQGNKQEAASVAKAQTPTVSEAEEQPLAALNAEPDVQVTASEQLEVPSTQVRMVVTRSANTCVVYCSLRVVTES